ncbi:hypothetical protein BY996DRAFT_6562315 [Phakopsora pachyrhizi]|nr:hypothetical protein BY996DRAFT_6562315 [Phakopsora pachyrhizi]
MTWPHEERRGARLGSPDLQDLQSDEWLGSMVVLTGRFLLLLLKGIEMGLWTLDLFKKEDGQANAVEVLMLVEIRMIYEFVGRGDGWYPQLAYHQRDTNAMIKPFKTAKTYNLEEMIKDWVDKAIGQFSGGFWRLLELSKAVDGAGEDWDYP